MKPFHSGYPSLILLWLLLAGSPAGAGDGMALAADGLDDYATAPHSPTLSLSPAIGESFTIEATFFVEAVARASNEMLLRKAQAYELGIEFRVPGAPLVRLFVWANELQGSEVTSQAQMQPGLHHLAAVVNRTAAQMTTASLYLDGFLLRSESILAPADSDQPLAVGGADGKFFKGWLDMVRLSNTARYSGDAYSIPEFPSISDASTRALWQFNESPGATVFADTSGHGNHLHAQSGTATAPMPDDSQPGTLDRTFNPGTGARSNIFPQGIYALARLPDGKLVIAGQFRNYNSIPRTHLARLNADGSLDTAFNPVITSGFGTGEIKGLAVQADGRIVIGGMFDSVNGVARDNIARLHADGTLDTEFNPVFVFNSGIKALELLPDGRMFLAGQLTMGNFGDRRSSLVRIHPDGTPDMGFNAGDIFGFIYHLLPQPDGQWLISGSFSTVNGNPRTGFARLGANGALDAGFAPVLSGISSNRGPDGFALQCDGSILIAGSFTSVNGSPRIGAARLYADGSTDPGFVIGGSGVFRAGGTLDWVSVLPDGKLLFNGVFKPSPGIGEPRLARFLPDGTVDPEYKPVIYHNPNDRVHAHLFLEDSRLLVAGEFSDIGGIRRNSIARLLGGPGLLPRFTGVNLLEDGQLQLILAGIPRCRYTLESAPPLAGWLPLRTDEMPASGLLVWLITPPAGFPHYFYRARQP